MSKKLHLEILDGCKTLESDQGLTINALGTKQTALTSLTTQLTPTTMYKLSGSIYVLVVLLNVIQAIPQSNANHQRLLFIQQDMSLVKDETAQAMMRELFAMEGNQKLLLSLSLPMSLSFSLPSLSMPPSTNTYPSINTSSSSSSSTGFSASINPSTLMRTTEPYVSPRPDFTDNLDNPTSVLTSVPTSKKTLMPVAQHALTSSPTSNGSLRNGPHESKTTEVQSNGVSSTNFPTTSQRPIKASITGSASDGRSQRTPSGGAIAGFAILAIIAVLGLALMVRYLFGFNHNSDHSLSSSSLSSRLDQKESDPGNDIIC